MADSQTQPFDIRQCLGSGGFGEVYLAHVQKGSAVAEVALKVLHSGLDPRSQGVQRLKDEARLLMMIDHPNILRTFDLVAMDGRVALVSEYIEGLDLEDLLEPLSIPLPAGLEVLARVADGLHAAYHTLGPQGTPLKLLHRDVKPGNIRISRAGGVKLLDFGIAKATGVTREAKTKTASVLGSFGYMAPERFDPQEEDTPAGDVCSLGAVMYELLNGEMLLENYDVRDMFRLALVEEKRDKALAQRLEDLGSQPEALISLMQALLSYDAADRPSLPEVSRRLDALAAELPGEGLAAWCRNFVWPPAPSLDGSLSGKTLIAEAMELDLSLSQATSDFATQSEGGPFDGMGFPPLPEPAPEILPLGDRAPPAPPAPTPVPLHAPIDADPPDESPFVGEPMSGYAIDDDSDEIVVRRSKPWLWVAAAAVVVGLGSLGIGVLGAASGFAFLGSGGEDIDRVPETAAGPVPKPVPSKPSPVRPIDKPAPGSPPVVPPTIPVEPQPADPDDAVVDAMEVEPTATGLDACGSLVGFEPNALLGKIAPADLTCLDGLLQRSTSQVERKKIGPVLINNAVAVCRGGGGCADYDRIQGYYFDEVDRSDPSMMLTFASSTLTRAGGSAGRLTTAHTWASRALDSKERWVDPVEYGRNVTRAYEVRAKAAYKLWELEKSNEDRRANARDGATDWANYLTQTGRKATEAFELCQSATGSAESCGARVTAEIVTDSIVLSSRPFGAVVTVDEKPGCPTTPCLVDLAFGPHAVELSLDGKSTSQDITVGGGSPKRWMWVVEPEEGEAAWSSR